MDFFAIRQRKLRNGTIEVYPEFKVCRSEDLMVRGKAFYAIWDEERGLWSTDEYDVQSLVDKELWDYAQKIRENTPENVYIKTMVDYSSGSWNQFRRYLNNVSDNYHELDETLTFADAEVKKSDYVSKRLPYSMKAGPIDAYDELMNVLYSPEERAKLEWAIGAVISGNSKYIQKFLVLYGEAGTGKSTFLGILESLFEGYTVPFDAKALASNGNAFSTEIFKNNPLVAIQHDGDLSRIEDNTKLNSIVSHETMTLNEKYKSSYASRINCFLFMGTNKPVKITDAKSGIIRRLIDVQPTGEKVDPQRYSSLINQIGFELGAIAKHCLDAYRKMGKNYYSGYRPVEMMFKTDVFFNFVEDSYDTFKARDGVTLKAAYSMYKEYCSESGTEAKLPMYKFREELKNYFKEFADAAFVDGTRVRSYYRGFKMEKFKKKLMGDRPDELKPYSIVLDRTESLLDEMLADCKAQYASTSEKPCERWSDVTTKLSDLDTGKLHYVRVPVNHIVIDFDLKDDNGEKNFEKNLAEASKWPSTYAEVSKSGKGIHLHYIYDGDPLQLSRSYAKDVEVKVFSGKSSLRRQRIKNNGVPVAVISSGLPLKGEKKVVNMEVVKSEKGLRRLIDRNLRKEIHPGTKPSVDFIHKILKDAYSSGLKYDVSDLRPSILAFANNSTNHAHYCIKLVNDMKFYSEEPVPADLFQKDEIIFYDVEVFPNLFVVVWKAQGKSPVKMINPTPEAIEELCKFKLVGFNCRRYDNHILYARMLGYTNHDLYELSQRIINNSRNGLFGAAYNISYTDVYDFSSKKQSLKKWEIELGIHHQELGLPWDQPVPEELWSKVAEYCINDVVATEEVFLARRQDFVAREILADISGLTVNDTTNQHTAKIIVGDDPNPQEKFVYTDLSETFPGYTFDHGRSFYRGEETGEGGYVYAEPGMYVDVALLDIASMHPHSAIALNIFGPYTKNFKDIVDARIAIKHRDFDTAGEMFGGKLKPYLENEDQADALAYALKIAINSVYGLTSASFDNKLRDPRNKDNIVAKRGALFMIDLKNAVQEKGFTVAHIKTDSIKIPNATPEIINFVVEFGKKYGYTFEHEATYEKMCLVNDAVYIAKYKMVDDPKSKYKPIKWVAVGTQFQRPYVFKRLFSKEPIEFSDVCETKTVSTALYLDMNEDLPDVSDYETELSDREYNRDLKEGKKPRKLNPDLSDISDETLESMISEGHNYQFVGKAGSFCPIKKGCGGGLLMREKDGKYSAATGSKGFRWLEAEMVKGLEKDHNIDYRYFDNMVDGAVDTINKYGDFEWFSSDDSYEELPWN